MEYPKRFDVCPNCGSMVRIVESEAKAEEEKGNITAGLPAACMVTNSVIFDPTKVSIIAPKEFPMITARFDICADCGTLYCVYVDKVKGMAEPHTGRSGSMNFPRGP